MWVGYSRTQTTELYSTGVASRKRTTIPFSEIELPRAITVRSLTSLYSRYSEFFMNRDLTRKC